jgi:hypothetical protein
MYEFMTESWPRRVIVNPECHNLDTGDVEPLVRYPIARANANDIVKDGWSQPHRAPSNGGPWELWQYVIGSQLARFEWRPAEKEA